MKDLLCRLSELFGPPGSESAVRKQVQAELEGIQAGYKQDALGNLIVRRGEGSKDGRRIMLAARMDEPGLMVSHVEEQGFVRFNLLGNLPVERLPGRTVRFENGTRGIVGVDGRSDSNPLQVSSLFIDVGSASRSACPVKAGDTAVFNSLVGEVSNAPGDGRMLAGQGLSTRAGAAILVEVLRQVTETPHEVFCVFASLGTTGGRGAGTAAYTLSPDLAVVVDAMPAADRPGSAAYLPHCGCGPVIQLGGGRIIYPRPAGDWLRDAAQRSGLPFQVSAQGGDGSTAEVIQSSRDGTPVAGLAIPVRQVQSALEFIHQDDVENAVRLLVAALQSPVKLR